MKKALLLFTLAPVLVFGQTLYDPQQLYDVPGGLFEKDSVRDVYLDFYDPNYHSVLVNSWFYTPDARIPAKLTLNGIEYDSVGVRYKGNSTFCLPNDDSNPKVPYNIDMNYWVSGQKVMGYKKIKLANAWMDPTFVKDFSASQIYSQYMPSGEANLLKLHCQGNYLGLYVNTESINKQFLTKHFDDKAGALFKCDNINRFCDTANAPQGLPPNLGYLGEDSTLYYNSYDMKSDHGWAGLVELIRTINNDFSNIGNILNVDRALWAFAVNQVTSNLDTYNGYYVHNYYLYQTGDGLFQMIPWDLDNTFLGAIMGWDYFTPENVYEFDPYFTDTQGSRPLVFNLLNDSNYRKQYTAHLRTVISEALDTATVRGKINQLQAFAANGAANDSWKGFTMAQYYENVESALWTWWGFGGIISTIDARKDYLLGHSEISLVPPSISFVQESNGGNLITAEVSNASTVELMTTISSYGSKFQPFAMYDDGTNGDAVSGDGVYSAYRPDFPPNTDTLKYYIRAQNSDAMMLSPERAEYEFYYSDPPVSIQESTIAGLTVYPNPMADRAHVFWPNPAQEKVQVDIMDINGRCIKRYNQTGTGMLLTREHTAPGVYFLTVRGGFGTLQEKLILR